MVDNPRTPAFEALMDVVYEPLQRYLLRRCEAHSVDDVLNDTLLAIWRRMDDVPEEPLPWCYGVARRCLANHRRSGQRRLRLVGRLERSIPLPRAEWTDASLVSLHEALDALEDVDREVVRLWAWERLEPREIATVLDTTPNAISVRLSRVRGHLKALLAENLSHERKDPAQSGQETRQSDLELER